MMTLLPLAVSSWDTEEYEALQEVIRSGHFSMGSVVSRFEDAFADFASTSHAVMASSGSAANLLMLAACRYAKSPVLEPGDEVIVPAVSWSTTYFPVNQVGARLRVVDVDPDTLNLTAASVREAITPRTRAILAVSLLGNPAPLDELETLAAEAGIVLLEDNCESLGASLNGRLTGTFGRMSTHSFFFSHHISTMEGGAVLTQDQSLRDALRSLRAHGWTRDLPRDSELRRIAPEEWGSKYEFVLPGYNLRPLELSAAVGIEQVKKLPGFLEQRRLNAEHWKSVMRDVPGVRVQSEHGNSSWFGFSIVLQGSLKGQRTRIVEALSNAGIETRPIVAGNIMRHSVVQHLDVLGGENLPVADEIHDHGLFIGNHHFAIRTALDRVAEILSVAGR
jgi:CDP-4-dehydro-6-deoxyglucose reductase, E1